MRSPLWPSSVTGTVVPASPPPIATRASLPRARAAGAAPPAGRATPASGRGTSGGGRSSLRASRGRVGRACDGSSSTKPPLYEVEWPGGAQRRIRALYTGFTRARWIPGSFRHRIQVAVPPARASSPRTGPGLISEDPRDPEAPSRHRPRCGPRARLGLRRRHRRRGAAPQRPALRVRVAPVAVQDVVYQIKSLGQIEAQDMVQVTAEVDGVATDVRFREGDRVGPGHRAPADRPRPLPAGGRAGAGRARAVAGGAGPRRGRPQAPRGAGPERAPLGRGADPLAAESARLAASVDVAKAALGIAQQNLQRAEVRPQVAGDHQHPDRRHRPVRADGHGARHDRRREPAAPPLQGVGGRVAARHGRAAR